MIWSDTFLAFKGLAPKRIPHWEHWSCPDAETYLTGIDYYEHPRLCRLQLARTLPAVESEIPNGRSATPASARLGGGVLRSTPKACVPGALGDGETDVWDQGQAFHTVEDVFAFSPLEHDDFRDWTVVEKLDFRDENQLYQTIKPSPGDITIASSPARAITAS